MSSETMDQIIETRVAGTPTGTEPVAASLLDAKQVARLLHVSESWVREHCNGKEPHLPAMKLGQGRTALVHRPISSL